MSAPTSEHQQPDGGQVESRGVEEPGVPQGPQASDAPPSPTPQSNEGAAAVAVEGDEETRPDTADDESINYMGSFSVNLSVRGSRNRFVGAHLLRRL